MEQISIETESGNTNDSQQDTKRLQKSRSKIEALLGPVETPEKGKVKIIRLEILRDEDQPSVVYYNSNETFSSYNPEGTNAHPCLLFSDIPKTVITLKEGTHWKLKVTFKVSDGTATGIRYSVDTTKDFAGMLVDSDLFIIGTFPAQEGPLEWTGPPTEVPSGFLARGGYKSLIKFCHEESTTVLECTQPFEIKKNW
eukprot:c27296_g1_i1.p1 GENE.c27296_g1_i1~~c27296_g1_i1.p1  ORF type:complete len:197 (-),score=68.14 c27296_g1_i1:82-672(-)